MMYRRGFLGLAAGVASYLAGGLYRSANSQDKFAKVEQKPYPYSLMDIVVSEQQFIVKKLDPTTRALIDAPEMDELLDKLRKGNEEIRALGRVTYGDDTLEDSLVGRVELQVGDERVIKYYLVTKNDSQRADITPPIINTWGFSPDRTVTAKIRDGQTIYNIAFAMRNNGENHGVDLKTGYNFGNMSSLFARMLNYITGRIESVNDKNDANRSPEHDTLYAQAPDGKFYPYAWRDIVEWVKNPNAPVSPLEDGVNLGEIARRSFGDSSGVFVFPFNSGTSPVDKWYFVKKIVSGDAGNGSTPSPSPLPTPTSTPAPIPTPQPTPSSTPTPQPNPTPPTQPPHQVDGIVRGDCYASGNLVPVNTYIGNRVGFELRIHELPPQHSIDSIVWKATPQGSIITFPDGNLIPPNRLVISQSYSIDGRTYRTQAILTLIPTPDGPNIPNSNTPRTVTFNCPDVNVLPQEDSGEPSGGGGAPPGGGGGSVPSD